MKTRIRNLIGLLGVFGVILSTVPVFAQPHGPGFRDPEVMKERMEARMGKIQEELNLSEAQAELLKAHKVRHRREMREYQENMRGKRQEIRTELERQDLDMDKVGQLHTELKELLVKKANHRLEGILEVREILTAEQFTDFMKLTGKHAHGHGKGMRHGPPDFPEE